MPQESVRVTARAKKRIHKNPHPLPRGEGGRHQRSGEGVIRLRPLPGNATSVFRSCGSAKSLTGKAARLKSESCVTSSSFLALAPFGGEGGPGKQRFPPGRVRGWYGRGTLRLH